ncbi:TolC family protein [Pedobacter sp. BS3]|uniref:TolC family protein n=1 Tax=Pedobacter sp. BS3 TaxID=2567937 RepID=UPI0011ED9204|nr:TolC family protein [Pedobacter sp. BS3]TZF84989.1 TolC family protein [Pedobacter sp. BS3]
MNKKSVFYLLLTIGLCTGMARTYAQESMIPDVSYVYLEKLIATAKQNYPRSKSYAMRTEIAKNNVSRQKMSWLEPFSFSYIYQPRTIINTVEPNFLTGYQVGINVNIGEILKKPYDIKEAKQQYSVAREDQQENDLSIEVEVKRRYFTYIQQLNTVRLYSNTLLDVDAMLKSIKLKYEKGEASFDQYSQALITFSNTTRTKIEAEANLLTAKAALEELLTIKLEEVK